MQKQSLFIKAITASTALLTSMTMSMSALAEIDIAETSVAILSPTLNQTLSTTPNETLNATEPTQGINTNPSNASINILPANIIPSSASSASSASSNLDCIDDESITTTNLMQTQDNGPFLVAHKSIGQDLATGFGGGTIHYPTNAGNCGLLGAIAVIPGYVSYESSIKWLGPRLAAWGFVVITINTNSIFDDPDSRAEQLSAALDHMIQDDTVGNRIDPTRLGVIGWSMGGGGALRLATQRSDVRAIVPLAPYHDKSYGEVSIPTLVITCEHDRIAANKKYSTPFYQQATGPKMQLEVNNGSHFCPSYRFNEKLLSPPTIAWMQRYINGDRRFDKFLCANQNYSNSRRFSHYAYANCF